MAVTQDIFWTEYTEFDNNNGSFDRYELLWKSKDIRDGNSNLWHQKYSLPCTEVIGFVACRVTSNVPGIVAADLFWGYVKTIKSGEISAIRSDVSQKQIIVYTYACIESAIIEQYNYEKQLDDNSSSHTWNEEDDDFDKQLEKWGAEKCFEINQNSSKYSRDLTLKTGVNFQ